MSASDKKKLRKEQNAAAITERQKKANKEARKMKVLTTVFVSIMAIVLAVAIFIGLFVSNGKPAIGLFNRVTTAVKIGDHKLNTVDLSYYYRRAVDSYISEFSEYYGESASMYLQMYGLNVTLPLDEQVYNSTTGETWADFFTTQAINDAKWVYAMYDKAMADGYKLTDAEEKSLAQIEDNLELYAPYYGYSSAKAYLRDYYGPGATVKSYIEYNRITTIANNYANEHKNGLEYTDSDYREHEKDKYDDYSSYTFSYYYLTVNNYLTFIGGGTEEKDENGKTTVTYTDEQKEAARKAAEEAAKGLAIADNNDLEKLNAAIKALNINKDKKDVAATEQKLVFGSDISNTNFKKYLTDKARKAGDITVIESTTGEGEEKTVNGYYVVLFQAVDDNTTPLANVQHILVKFEGGTKDTTNNNTIVYSDEEKKKAKDEAEAILKEFLAGEKQDSEAFGKLAEAKTDDTGSKTTGGLYEDIYRDSNYVQSFKDWALAGHKPGDTGIIESPYGYHVMFYKEDDELTYRDLLIQYELRNEDHNAWQEEVAEAISVTVKYTKGLDRDMVISR